MREGRIALARLIREVFALLVAPPEGKLGPILRGSLRSETLGLGRYPGMARREGGDSETSPRVSAAGINRGAGLGSAAVDLRTTRRPGTSTLPSFGLSRLRGNYGSELLLPATGARLEASAIAVK